MIENVFCGAANMRRMRKIKFGTMVPSESLIISLGGLGGLWKGRRIWQEQIVLQRETSLGMTE